MAQNQNSTNSEGICKKFYKKLSLSSHTNKKVTFFLPKMPSDLKQPPPAADHSPNREQVPPRRHGGGKAAAKATAGKSKADDGKFSDYIRKVKEKMRRSATAAKTETKRDSFDDKVSRYIDRAKSRMRRTSDVGRAEKNV